MPIYNPDQNAYIFDDAEDQPFILPDDETHFLVRIIGNTHANTITGNSATNIIDGGIGADTMSGGFGNDIYYVDNADDEVVEGLGQGTDEVRASASYVLRNTVENLRLLEGAGNINGTGNALDNSIEDNEGSNILDGGAGNDILTSLSGGEDTLKGGSGNDVYWINNGNTVLDENENEGIDTIHSRIDFDLSARGVHIENLKLWGENAVNGIGNALNNLIEGSVYANLLVGKEGNDTLDSGTASVHTTGSDLNGFDRLEGGAGDDLYIVRHANVIVREIDGEGTDTIEACLDYDLSEAPFVENLLLSYEGNASTGRGNARDNYIRGNGYSNVLLGGSGNDTLDGSSGDDALWGGQGNDTFFIDNERDVVFEGSDEGTDTAFTSVSHVLEANVENLTAYHVLFSVPLRLTGNTLDNLITGHSRVDIIRGGSGGDTLDGGGGRDVLTGGTGRDTFVFKDRPGSTRYDRITDYNKSYDSFQLDNRYMSKLGSVGRLSSSKFVVGTHAKDADDHLIYDRSTGKLYYDADGSGAGAQVLIAQFTNKAALTYGEFTII